MAGTPLATQPLEKVVLATWNGGKPTPAFKNAAQVGALLWHSGLYGERGQGAPGAGVLSALLYSGL